MDAIIQSLKEEPLELPNPISLPPIISLPGIGSPILGLPELPPTSKRKRQDYQCRKCKKRFPTSHALNQHKREKHEVLCPHCGRDFVSETRLKRHMEICHTKKTDEVESDEFKEVRTELSAKEQAAEDEIDEEMKMMMESQPPDFVCGVCGKSWRRINEDLYRSHLEKAHGPFVCLVPGCRKVFAQWGGLYRHKTEVHAKKRGFQCGICRKQFKRRYVCVKHMCSLHKFDLETQRSQILQLILRPEITDELPARMPRIPMPKQENDFFQTERPSFQPVLAPAPRYFAIRSKGRPGKVMKRKKKVTFLQSHMIEPF